MNKKALELNHTIDHIDQQTQNILSSIHGINILVIRIDQILRNKINLNNLKTKNLESRHVTSLTIMEQIKESKIRVGWLWWGLAVVGPSCGGRGCVPSMGEDEVQAHLVHS
jgi:hypothetical protein